jgi:hypothetical protein
MFSSVKLNKLARKKKFEDERRQSEREKKKERNGHE